MFALFLTALLSAIALATVGVLADSWLRWWSAFGVLRRELKGDAAPLLPSLRPAAPVTGHAAFDRSPAIRPVVTSVSRAA